MQTQVNQEVKNVAAQQFIASMSIPNYVPLVFSTGSKNAGNVVSSLIPFLKLSTIVQDRKQWESSAYLTSNQQLYSVLAQCYSFYHEMCKSDDVGKAMREELLIFSTQNEIKTKSGTHGIVKVVKCVFFDDARSCDRRRISTYSLALRCALDNKVAVADLSVFIEENGGVQELRRFKTTKSLSLSDRSERARFALQSATPLTTFQNEAISQSIDATDYDQPFVAVFVKRADGQIEIHGVVKNKAAVNAALATLFPSKSSV